jgi:glycerol-3-phosphate acyltransferase PlsY
VVFLFDLLKGFLPTWGLPLLLNQLGETPPIDLPALIAVAAILGHSFPVYLGFRGGKGISTGLGAVLALDPVSAGISACVFVATAVCTRYVSLSSVLGVIGFLAARMLVHREPWSRANVALTAGSLILGLLIIYRHRGNLARIAAGTEPRVGGRKNQEPSQ